MYVLCNVADEECRNLREGGISTCLNLKHIGTEWRWTEGSFGKRHGRKETYANGRKRVRGDLFSKALALKVLYRAVSMALVMHGEAGLTIEASSALRTVSKSSFAMSCVPVPQSSHASSRRIP